MGTEPWKPNHPSVVEKEQVLLLQYLFDFANGREKDFGPLKAGILRNHSGGKFTPEEKEKFQRWLRLGLQDVAAGKTWEFKSPSIAEVKVAPNGVRYHDSNEMALCERVVEMMMVGQFWRVLTCRR